MRSSLALLVGAGAALALTDFAHAADAGPLGIGHAATPAQIAGWDIDVRADGQGLPAGRGSVRQGETIFAQACAACHGAKGEGKPADQLVGGFGTLATAKPVRTVGSYWPYATTLFDFIRRAMPFNAPQSLTADEVYAVAAYILYLNNIVPADTVLDAGSLPKVAMPNRNGFTSPDPRPDVR
jgi:S-disulfanyl-L-cysteine oxidoreductase SoxD